MGMVLDIYRFWKDKAREKIRKGSKKRFFSEFVKEGDLCFDIGANIGDMTQLFVEMGLRVVSVEPQPACVTKLKERFNNNPKVSIVEKALGAEEGETEMHVCEDISVLSTISEKWIERSRFAHNQRVHWDKKIKVKITTLDVLIRQYGKPRFCKIDVEGYEANVVKGLTTQVKYVSFEFMKEFLEDAEEILRIMESISSIRVNYSVAEEYESKKFANRWNSASGIICELKQLEDPKLWGDIYVEMQ